MRIRVELKRSQTKPNRNPSTSRAPRRTPLRPHPGYHRHNIRYVLHIIDATNVISHHRFLFLDMLSRLSILPNQYIQYNLCLKLVQNRSKARDFRSKPFETRSFLQKTAQNRSKTLRKHPLFYLLPAQNPPKNHHFAQQFPTCLIYNLQ